MRIWLIHMGELVQSDGPSARLYRLGLLAEQLVARGHDVVRWVPTFVHTSKTQRCDTDAVVRIDARHEIRMIYAKGYTRHLGAGRLRFHREVARRWESLQERLAAPDLIVTSMPTPDICAAAGRISRSRGVPYVIDVRDLWPDVLEEALPRWLRWPARLASLPMTLSNRTSFRDATAITGISDEFVEWGVKLARRRRGPADSAFVPGYAPPRAAPEDVAEATARWQRTLPPGAFVCLFLGTFGAQFDLSTVLRAARQLASEEPGRYAWVLCGDGPARRRLAAEAGDIDGVYLPGWVDGAEVVALLNLADVGLAPYAGSRGRTDEPTSRVSFAGGLPNKPFEYASAGLPVVSSLHGKFGELLVRERFGALYPPDDVQGLVSLLRRYAADPDLRVRHGAAGHQLWNRQFSAASVYGRMAEHLERVASAPPHDSTDTDGEDGDMGTEMTGAGMYRSPLFRAARTVLVRAERELPRPMYNALYRSAFKVYRTALEVEHRASLVRRRRRGDWEGVRRGEAVAKVLPFSLVGPQGLEATYDAVLDAMRRGVPGAIVECGVAQGGSSAVMALALRDAGEARHLWLFDSYEGLPDATSDDIDPASGATGAHIRPLPKGSCLGTVEEVDHLMGEIIGLPRDRYTLVKGWFQDTVKAHAEAVGDIAVLRLDGDWYESTRCCLDGLYAQLAPGGLLVVDDYHSCFGARRATMEFLAEQGDHAPRLVDDGSGGVLYTKP